MSKVISNSGDEITSWPIDLGAIDENGSIRITKKQLLKSNYDVDSDALTITDLQLSKGDGQLSVITDGNWSFKPSKDWNGEVEFSYCVTDGESSDSHKINDKVFTRGNSLYMVVDGPTWAEANDNAQAIGGNLVTINSKEEQMFLNKNAPNLNL